MPTLVVEILDGIAIDGFLPDAPYGVSYHAQLRGYGATEPLVWSVAAGALPGGWSLDAETGEVTGLVNGGTGSGGLFDVTIQLTDVLGYYVQRRFQFRVANPPITIAAPPGEYSWPVDTAVSVNLAITGGTGVYVSAIVSSGAMPDGITVGISGSNLTLTGTPTEKMTGSASIIVTDSDGAQGVVSLAWKVVDLRIYVAGYWTSASGANRRHIVRLKQDGTIDTTFASPTTGAGLSLDFYSDLVIQSSGKIIICGVRDYGGVQYINRLNSDGSADGTWGLTSPSATSNGVYRMAARADGKIYVAGADEWNGVSRSNGIARLHADGTLDTGFEVAMPSGYSTYERNTDMTLATPDGGCIVSQTVYGPAYPNWLQRYDQFGNGNMEGVWLDGKAACGVGLPSGGYLIGGYFNNAWPEDFSAWQLTGRLIKINSDYTLNPDFNPNFNNTIRALCVLASGKILVGGDFTSVNGTTRYRLARINTDGTLDTSFNAGNINNAVTGIAELPNGEIWIVGNFTSVAASSRTRFARLNSSGSLISGTVATFNYAPVCIQVAS